MQNEKYSNELNRLLTFMESTMMDEMPIPTYNLDYFILSILQQKDSFIYKRLDENLTTMTMNTIFESYYQLVQQKRLNGMRLNREIKYDAQLLDILEKSDNERNLMGDEKITSEHVFLAILNDDNKARKVFNKAGIEYSIFFDKIQNNKNVNDIKEESQAIQQIQIPEGATVIKIDTNGDPTEIINKLMGNNSNPSGSQTSRKDKNSVLDKYCINLNKLAQKGKIDKVIGRQKEIDSIVRILGRRKKNNVVLVGDGGCGKTAICEGLAYLIEKGEAPSFILKKKIYMLDMAAMIAGTTLRGMFEERAKALIDEIKGNKDIILLVDNIDTVFTNRGQNDYDFASIISGPLENGEIQIISTCDFKGYRNTFDKNNSLGRKFQKLVVESPNREECINIINGIKGYYEKFHNVIYSDEVIRACVDMSQRYITERNLPDSAIDVIDEVGANYSTRNKSNEIIDKLQGEYNNIKSKIALLKSEDKYDEADKLSIDEKRLAVELIEEQKKFKEENKNKTPSDITINDIQEIISTKTGIPVTKLTNDDKTKIATMNERIKAEVIGQNSAIDSVCRAIKRNRIGLKNGKNCGTFFFLGESGVGKTLLAKKIAKELFGDESAIVRFDMSEYADKTSVNKLIGASSGYIGYEEGGLITESVKNKKYCVLLLDEIEKADNEVYNLFLQVFDEGYLTDNTGQKIDFKNTIIILTSNVGTKTANEFSKSIGFVSNENETNRKLIVKELKKKFPPEFLNRLDDIIYFNKLNDENLREIISIEMNKMCKRVSDIGYSVIYDETCINHIMSCIKDEKEYGARPIIRAIESEFEDRIADAILSNDYKEHTFKITVTENVNVF